MDSVTKISGEAVPAAANDVMITAMAVGLHLAPVVFACMATSGL